VDYLFAVINPEWSGDIKLPMRKTEKSYLFELIPGVADHNSLGLRGPEIDIKKPEDVFRIIVIGDSVTYGLYVDAPQAFPAQIEKMLAGKKIDGRKIEVINAGVPAFTTYNELHLYKDKLKALSPDLVILGFCMNDVVDPFFHWSNIGQPDLNIPEEALPNKDYHEQQLREDFVGVVLQQLPDWSNLKRYFVVKHLTNKTLATSKSIIDGKSYPVYLALEQPVTIDVYNDYESPEWHWLRRQIGELSENLKSEQTDFLFLLLPLAYQIEPDYPFSPSASFKRFCIESKIECLDMLDSMKGQPLNDLFQSIRSGYYDIWHLTPLGHEKVAIDLVEKKIKPKIIKASQEAETTTP
jgi:hypothetical protein